MKAIKIIILLSIVVMMASAKGFAYFSTTFWGVRAMGMGGAFTAVANDASAPIYNAAGPGFMKSAEVTGMASKLFAGLNDVEINDDFLAGVVPINDTIGSISAGWGHFGGVGLYTEDTVYLGYARNLNDLIKLDWMQIALGVNAKYLSHSLDTSHSYDPVGTLSTDAIAIDVGIMAKFSNGITVGYSGRQLNTPNMGFYSDLGSYDILAANDLGVSYYSEKLPILGLPKFTIAADYLMRGGDNTLAFGAETRVIDGALALRVGGWSEQINLGIGYELKIGDSALLIDYAFGMPFDVQETIGSHFISLGYRFASPTPKPQVASAQPQQSLQAAQPAPEAPAVQQSSPDTSNQSSVSSDNSSNSSGDTSSSNSNDSDFDAAKYLLNQ